MTVTWRRNIYVIGHKWFFIDWNRFRQIVDRIPDCDGHGLEQWHWKRIPLTRWNTNDDRPLAPLGNAIIGSVEDSCIDIVTE